MRRDELCRLGPVQEADGWSFGGPAANELRSARSNDLAREALAQRERPAFVFLAAVHLADDFHRLARLVVHGEEKDRRVHHPRRLVRHLGALPGKERTAVAAPEAVLSEGQRSQSRAHAELDHHGVQSEQQGTRHRRGEPPALHGEAAVDICAEQPHRQRAVAGHRLRLELHLGRVERRRQRLRDRVDL